MKRLAPVTPAKGLLSHMHNQMVPSALVNAYGPHCQLKSRDVLISVVDVYLLFFGMPALPPTQIMKSSIVIMAAWQNHKKYMDPLLRWIM
jgi:hypothetical protein